MRPLEHPAARAIYTPKYHDRHIEVGSSARRTRTLTPMGADGRPALAVIGKVIDLDGVVTNAPVADVTHNTDELVPLQEARAACVERSTGVDREIPQRSPRQPFRAICGDGGVCEMVAPIDDDIDEPALFPTTILVEFGRLTVEQQLHVDLHTLRAVGTVVPAPIHTQGVVVEFWLRDGETADEAYDDIRGWAIGHRLPIRAIHGE